MFIIEWNFHHWVEFFIIELCSETFIFGSSFILFESNFFIFGLNFASIKWIFIFGSNFRLKFVEFLFLGWILWMKFLCLCEVFHFECSFHIILSFNNNKIVNSISINLIRLKHQSLPVSLISRIRQKYPPVIHILSIYRPLSLSTRISDQFRVFRFRNEFT